MEYMPKLQFYRLSIFGKEYNIYHFLRQDKDVEVLELDYSQNFFNLSFVAEVIFLAIPPTLISDG